MKYRLGFVLMAACSVVLASASTTFAHAGHGQESFAAGLTHPVLGLDHLLAMLAVGLLASRIGGRPMWVLPAVFVGMMLVGGLVGLARSGQGATVMEWGAAMSVVVLGLAIAMPKLSTSWTVRRTMVAAVMVGAFAGCHGFAHATEIGGASAWGYFPGMLLMTAGLHVAGLAGGLMLQRGVGTWSVRAAGGAVAAAFVCMLVLAGL